MMEQLTGVVGILLGIWEIYAVYKAFKDTKQRGNKNTSTFLPLALWSGFSFSFYRDWHSTSHENVLSESLSAKLINKIN